MVSESSEDPTPIGGICGRGGDPSCDVSLAGSFVEGRCDGGALEFGGFEVALGYEDVCMRRDRIFMRRDRTTEVREVRGSMPSADSRSKNSI